MSEHTIPRHFFAVVPDGADEPTALFLELEDAIQWGLAKCGPEQFAIRGFVSGEQKTPPRMTEDVHEDCSPAQVHKLMN